MPWGRHRNQVAVGRLSAITGVTPDLIATATLVVETPGEGFFEFTREAKRFIADAGR